MTIDTEQLRARAQWGREFLDRRLPDRLDGAADEIDRLRADNARLRALLTEAREWLRPWSMALDEEGALLECICGIDAALDGGEEA